MSHIRGAGESAAKAAGRPAMKLKGKAEMQNRNAAHEAAIRAHIGAYYGASEPSRSNHAKAGNAHTRALELLEAGAPGYLAASRAACSLSLEAGLNEETSRALRALTRH
jgi:hypothetical protein